ncbi:hypothetical protein RRG08_021588 [Elysia crispata]|uniref:Uncharacterized protein n=1 Tax=Elysia crispata TaxID=231223 RepID=A0AAE0XDN1_9GAST|nr:hypothetical protein RRG08_021588 [Elysia crispata]
MLVSLLTSSGWSWLLEKITSSSRVSENLIGWKRQDEIEENYSTGLRGAHSRLLPLERVTLAACQHLDVTPGSAVRNGYTSRAEQPDLLESPYQNMHRTWPLQVLFISRSHNDNRRLAAVAEPAVSNLVVLIRVSLAVPLLSATNRPQLQLSAPLMSVPHKY